MRGQGRWAYATGLATVVLLAGCAQGRGAASPTTMTTTLGSPTSTTSTTTTTTTRVPTPKTTPKATAKPAPKPAPKPRPRPSAPPTPVAKVAPPPQARCLVPAGVMAAQVVLVHGSGSQATVRACHRTATGYALDLGPYYGHVGINGVSWSKREGDLRTPAGTYPLRGGFGIRTNPGLPQGWFTVDSNDVWVDDSASSLYNTHQRKPANGRWTSAENLLKTPAYTYAQVIGYNEARTPGRGSAIFFHVDTGGGTAGCVSLPSGALLTVMRWERAGAVMSIG
jgi:L,D-peptidoglycan transpeptidase YkuD (ErfK/YbiS/YcfS/YnhG family)